jgi:hypothetical protein
MGKAARGAGEGKWSMRGRGEEERRGEERVSGAAAADCRGSQLGVAG